MIDLRDAIIQTLRVSLDDNQAIPPNQTVQGTHSTPLPRVQAQGNEGCLHVPTKPGCNANYGGRVMPKTVLQTLQGANLDITGYKLKKREKLMEQINQDCKDSILFAGRHRPDKIYMTYDQFNLLEDDFQRLNETAYRLFRTDRGFVMEVHIIDAPEWVDVEALTGYAPEDEINFEQAAQSGQTNSND